MTDLQISREENYPELNVVVDRQKAGTLGLSEQQVAQTVLTSLVGNTQFAPIPFTDEKTGNEYFINVRLDDAYRSHVDDMSDLFMRGPTGAMVPLDTIARVDRGSGPVVINRKYLQRIIDVTANVAPGKDLGGASAAVQRVLDEEINPAVASHGGVVTLIDVKGSTAYIQLGGGCQGCGMASVTLTQGIEVVIKESVPEILKVVDVTDHASGENPYFESAKK
jgi:multidrug efflux pump subunit AcrB